MHSTECCLLLKRIVSKLKHLQVVISNYISVKPQGLFKKVELDSAYNISSKLKTKLYFDLKQNRDIR